MWGMNGQKSNSRERGERDRVEGRNECELFAFGKILYDRINSKKGKLIESYDERNSKYVHSALSVDRRRLLLPEVEKLDNVRP